MGVVVVMHIPVVLIPEAEAVESLGEMVEMLAAIMAVAVADLEVMAETVVIRLLTLLTAAEEAEAFLRKAAMAAASQHAAKTVLFQVVEEAEGEIVTIQAHLRAAMVAPADASSTISVRGALNNGISDFKRRRSYQYHRI